MRSRFVRLIALLFLLAVPAFAGTEMTLYTDMEPDLLNRYSRDLAERFPDLDIRWVRESAGPVTARLLAEKDNPQADMIFGLALTGILAVDGQGGLEPCTPGGFDTLNPMMRDSRDNPAWVGMHVVAGAIAVNAPDMKAIGLAAPRSWEDLTRPEYKGRIVMPNPVSSGTAYLHVTGWLQNMGPENAWAFMEDLHKNVSMYVHSGSRPAQMAAMGETPIGVTVDAYIAPYRKKNAPVESIVPEGGVGWDILASAVVKGCRHPEEAKRLMEYAISMDSARIGLEFDYLPVRPELDDERMAILRSRLLPVDLPRAAVERERTLAEWRRRFGGE